MPSLRSKQAATEMKRLPHCLLAILKWREIAERWRLGCFSWGKPRMYIRVPCSSSNEATLCKRSAHAPFPLEPCCTPHTTPPQFTPTNSETKTGTGARQHEVQTATTQCSSYLLHRDVSAFGCVSGVRLVNPRQFRWATDRRERRSTSDFFIGTTCPAG